MEPPTPIALAVSLALTQAIGRTRTVDEIYAAALDALEQALDVRQASILLFDRDGVMRFKAWRGLSEAYRHAVEGHTPWRPDTLDPQPIVVADVTAEPSLAPLLAAIEAEGIGALAFIPLVCQRQVIGKFMLYWAAPRSLDESELQLASLVASLVAFAVERTRTEEQARRGEARLRFALEAARMGTWDWEIGAGTVRWSENLAALHGQAPSAIPRSFADYAREIHPEDRPRVLRAIEQAIAGGSDYAAEYRIVAPDGRRLWVEGKGTVERDADGRAVRMSGVCMDITPRKEAERARVEALEESGRASSRLAAIVASSGDAIVSKTLDGIITSWNRAAEHLFGYTEAEAVGRSITLIIPFDRLEEEAWVLAQVRAGEQVHLETLRQRRDGSLIPVSLMVSPMRDASGRIVGAAKTARDITARKADEAERAELHRRLGLLVSASASLLTTTESASVAAVTVAIAQQLLVADGYAVWVSDRDGPGWHVLNTAGVSRALAASVVEPEDVVAVEAVLALETPLAVDDVETSPFVARRLAMYRREGIRSLLVCPMRLGEARAGTLVFYYRRQCTFKGIDIETGQTLANLAAAAMTTADLHEQLRAQRNAADAARRHAAFLADTTALLARSLDHESALAAVARLAVPEFADWCAIDVVQPDGALKRVAIAHPDPAKVEQARTLFERYPVDAEIPGSVPDVVRSGVPVLVPRIPADGLAAYAIDDEHHRVLAALGLTSYICVPLVSASGTLGAMTFLSAESGREYGERDLLLVRELAARAALAIENALAYRRVHEASRLKDEFLATLSHELRTPLNAILGYSQMLCRGVVGADKQASALAVLRRNAVSLKQIIDDVLDVSRITSGKLRLQVEAVDLHGILGDAIDTIQPAADAKRVALERHGDGSRPTVSGDRDRLQQVAWNLLSNAVKFTPAGGTVRVELRSLGEVAEIAVVDNGQGIEPAFLPHLFQRFRQADSRFSREHGGLGIGLAIVRELTELHGGTVAASSDGVGRGATFIVRLPLAIVRRATDDQPQRASTSSGSAA